MYLDFILQLLSIYCAIKVFDVKNPISSVLFLISLFGSVSIYFYINGLTFLSLSFIIIYIGAISILFVFIIMLLDIRISEIQNNNLNSVPLAIAIVIFLSYFFLKISVVVPLEKPTVETSLPWGIDWNAKYTNVNVITNNNWDNNIIEVNHITSIGSVLYTSYNIWLVIISIILLLSMVGTITITMDRSSYKE